MCPICASRLRVKLTSTASFPCPDYLSTDLTRLRRESARAVPSAFYSVILADGFFRSETDASLRGGGRSTVFFNQSLEWISIMAYNYPDSLSG